MFSFRKVYGIAGGGGMDLRQIGLSTLLLLLAVSVLAQPRIEVRMDSWPSDSLLAGRVRLEVESALASYPPELQRRAASSGEPLRVRVAPDKRRFFEWSGGRSPDWAAGLAMEHGRVILLEKSYLLDWARGRSLIRHEVAHIVLDRLMGPNHAPRWFHEGFAQNNSAEWNTRSMWELSLASWLKRTIPLAELERSFPLEGPRARLAYAQSQAAVLELMREPEAWGHLLDQLGDRVPFDQALKRAFGHGTAEFAKRFDAKSVAGFRTWGLQYSGTAVFLLMALLAIAGGLRRMRRRRRLATSIEVEGREAGTDSNAEAEQENIWKGRGWIDRGRRG